MGTLSSELAARNESVIHSARWSGSRRSLRTRSSWALAMIGVSTNIESVEVATWASRVNESPPNYNGMKCVREGARPISADTGQVGTRMAVEGDARRAKTPPANRAFCLGSAGSARGGDYIIRSASHSAPAGSSLG